MIKTKYRYQASEMSAILQHLEGHCPTSVADVSTVAAMSPYRARHLLTHLAVTPCRRGGRRAAETWVVRPNARAIAAAILEEHETRQAPGLKSWNHPANRQATAPGETFPRGEPHYFETDGMGKVISYTGPAAVTDDRWRLDEEAAA